MSVRKEKVNYLMDGGRGHEWWCMWMVVGADGSGCRWQWMQMVVNADGGECRWWWMWMVVNATCTHEHHVISGMVCSNIVR